MTSQVLLIDGSLDGSTAICCSVPHPFEIVIVDLNRSMTREIYSRDDQLSEATGVSVYKFERSVAAPSTSYIIDLTTGVQQYLRYPPFFTDHKKGWKRPLP